MWARAKNSAFFVTTVRCVSGDVAFDGTRGTRCEDPAGSGTGQHQPANASHGSLHRGAPCNALGECLRDFFSVPFACAVGTAAVCRGVFLK